MPKKAFLNLPEEARSELMEKVMALFVSRDYEEITMANLLEALEIHPTTFYRYFEDKKELYFYILRSIAEKRKSFLDDGQAYGMGFFFYNDSDNCAPLTELEIDFIRTVNKLPMEMLLHLYVKEFKDETVSILKERLRLLRYDGKLRPNIDDDLIAFIGATIPLNMLLFGREVGLENEEVLKKMNRYLFEDFFSHGLMTDEVYAEQKKQERADG